MAAICFGFLEAQLQLLSGDFGSVIGPNFTMESNETDPCSDATLDIGQPASSEPSPCSSFNYLNLPLIFPSVSNQITADQEA